MPMGMQIISQRAVTNPVFLALAIVMGALCILPVSAVDPARQLQAAQEAYQKKPSDKEAGKQLARALMGADRPKDAAKLMEGIAENAPSDAEAHMIYGESQFRSGKYPEAAIELKRAFNMDSTKGQYAVRAGEALLAAKRFDDLSEWTQNALTKNLDPTSRTGIEWLQKSAETRGSKPKVTGKIKGGA